MAPREPPHILRSYETTMQNLVAYNTQTLVCQVATKTNAFFVASFEGERNDGGVLLGSPAVGDDITERYFNNIEADSEQVDTVTVDVKSIAPIVNHNKTVFWRYTFTPAQLGSCQAVIFISAKDPDYVALVPMHCLRHEKQLTRLEFASQNIRPLWTLHPPPGFPPELAPFMRSLSQLGEGLANMRDVTNASLRDLDAIRGQHW